MQKYLNSGMTLLELLVVMSIATIILSASIPYFGDIIDRNRLKGAGDMIFADLRLAQSESIKRNHRFFVNFKTSEDSWCYGISQTKACDCRIPNQCQIDNVSKVVKSSKFKNITLQKAKFAGNKTYTVFDPLKGFALENGVRNGTIWIKSKNDTQLAIIVNRLGRVRFCSPTLPGYSRQCPTPP